MSGINDESARRTNEEAENEGSHQDLPKKNSVDSDSWSHKATINEVVDNDDPELILLKQLRLAFSSMLQMLETARDDLVLLGHRMDGLREASEKCRKIVEKRRNVEQRKEKEMEI